MASSELILLKPNPLLVLMPKTGKITGVGRKLFNVLLHQSLKQLDEYKALHKQAPPLTHLFSARASELVDPIERGASNLRSVLRKNLLTLRRSEIDSEAPDAKSGTVWSNLSLLSSVRFVIQDGNLWVYWAFPPEIIEVLAADSAKFTLLDLEQMADLSNYTAVSLYEICARYRNNFLRGGTGECLTCSNPPEWWVDALTWAPNKVDKTTGQKIRREWRKVKNELVNPAIEEIGRVTDYDIKLREVRKDRAITSVQFEVRSKKPKPREIPIPVYEQLLHGAKLGLSEGQIESAIHRSSVEQVGLGLAKLEARMAQHDQPPITNLAAYFKTITPANVPAIKAVEGLTPVTPIAKTAAAGIPADGQNQERAIARSEFMILSNSEKQVFADEALNILASKGVITDKLRKNAKEGVWTGVLLSKMIEIYLSGHKPQAKA
jgi:hypothetical protein